MRGRPAGERLHKHLADLGLASRRTIESWIEQGKITLNGKVAQLGDKVSPGSHISVDGRPLRSRSAPRQRRVILYHKPEGEISTRKDPGQRPTVFRGLPKLKGERWVAVGRLDINTRGLLLFTNDGELANRLMHPRFGLEREYLCRVYGRVNADAIARLKAGVMIDRQRVQFLGVRRQRGQGESGGRGGGGDGQSRNSWYSVVVGEGRYREIRRMWEAVGCRLSRLMRVRYGNVVLPKTLKPGQWCELEPAAISGLLSCGRGDEQPDKERRVSSPAHKKAPPAPRK